MIAKVLQTLFFQGMQDYFFAKRTIIICINCEKSLTLHSTYSRSMCKGSILRSFVSGLRPH